MDVSLATARIPRRVCAGLSPLLMVFLCPVVLLGMPTAFAYADGVDGAGGAAIVEAPAQNDSATDKPSIPIADRAGWVRATDGSWYYFAVPGGAPSTGSLNLGGAWYYLNPAANGKMATGKFSDGKGTYICDASGVMRSKGWVKQESDWYYASPSGSLQTGWVKSKKAWYYLAPDSFAMVTGWANDRGTWYLMNSSGAMQSGWQKAGDAWYYLQPDKAGLMAANELKSIGGALYSFDSSGAMRSDTAVDMGTNKVGYAASSGAITQVGVRENGKVVLRNAQGQPLTGWQHLGSAWFYGEAGGVAHTGWLDLDGRRYWMDANGVMATGARTIDGKTCFFDSTGAYSPVAEKHAAVFQLAIAELERCTTPSMTKEEKLWAAFKHLRDDFPEYNPRIPHLKSPGWEVIYANDVFIGRGDNCFSYGAAMAFMAKVIGYDEVYACNDGHGYAEIDGLIYDPEWAKNHRSSNAWYARSRNTPGAPGYIELRYANSLWMRVAI